jgi:hypothetical protein
MKEFFKSVWNEAFEGCTPLMIVKRIVAFFVIAVVMFVFCGADGIGGFWVAFTLCIAVLIWKGCNLSSAFPKKKDYNDKF